MQQVVSRNPRLALGEVIVEFSIPGVMAKFSYLCEFSFPRREILAEVSPSTPAWLLYPQRLFHIMARGVQIEKTATELRTSPGFVANLPGCGSSAPHPFLVDGCPFFRTSWGTFSLTILPTMNPKTFIAEIICWIKSRRGTKS